MKIEWNGNQGRKRLEECSIYKKWPQIQRVEDVWKKVASTCSKAGIRLGCGVGVALGELR